MPRPRVKGEETSCGALRVICALAWEGQVVAGEASESRQDPSSSQEGRALSRGQGHCGRQAQEPQATPTERAAGAHFATWRACF